MSINGKKIAILATPWIRAVGARGPAGQAEAARSAGRYRCRLKRGIKGWQMKDWGRSVRVDKTLDEAKPEDYDALVLPGGQINPDLLRVNPKALNFIRAMFDQKKVIAAVCHAPWLLIETGIIKGRKATSYPSIKTDMINAGARWEDSEVVTDQGIGTLRKPDDLEAFSAKIAEEIGEGRHQQRVA